MNLIIISQDECMGEGGKYLVKTGQNTVNLWVRPRMMIRSRRYYAPKLHACPWTFSLSTPSSDGRFFFENITICINGEIILYYIVEMTYISYGTIKDLLRNKPRQSHLLA